MHAAISHQWQITFSAHAAISLLLIVQTSIYISFMLYENMEATYTYIVLIFNLCMKILKMQYIHKIITQWYFHTILSFVECENETKDITRHNHALQILTIQVNILLRNVHKTFSNTEWLHLVHEFTLPGIFTVSQQNNRFF